MKRFLHGNSRTRPTTIFHTTAQPLTNAPFPSRPFLTICAEVSYPFLRIAMEPGNLPPVTRLPHLSTSERATILDRLFEPCVPLHTLSISLLRETTFNSYDDLISSIGIQLTELAESSSSSDRQWLESILEAHPRLGQSKVDSEQSRVEQAQLNTGEESELQALAELNVLYEETFPGLRYVYILSIEHLCAETD